MLNIFRIQIVFFHHAGPVKYWSGSEIPIFPLFTKSSKNLGKMSVSHNNLTNSPSPWTLFWCMYIYSPSPRPKLFLAPPSNELHDSTVYVLCYVPNMHETYLAMYIASGKTWLVKDKRKNLAYTYSWILSKHTIYVGKYQCFGSGSVIFSWILG